MDMGVIKNWSAHYKSRLNSRIISAMDSDLSLPTLDIAKSISLLDALYISKQSWDAVEGKTIAKCFHKGGYVELGTMSSLQDDNSNFDMLDDVSLPSNMSLENPDSSIELYFQNNKGRSHLLNIMLLLCQFFLDLIPAVTFHQVSDLEAENSIRPFLI